MARQHWDGDGMETALHPQGPLYRTEQHGALGIGLAGSQQSEILDQPPENLQIHGAPPTVGMP